uniref:siroheme decarboxylase n=1 Tax=uncultured bacterium 888 TaxID=548896 RepID=B8R8P5_9BACT|nr:putative nitrite reductase [NAD(P)H] small subunit NirD [uncultured bacterium 888]
MDRIVFALLNDFQREFPLVSRPFRILAHRCGTTEGAVLRILRDLHAAGAVSRIGAVVARGCLGASTLSALAVPPHALDAVADAISAMPAVNHNYAREHHYNLWFVANAANRAALDELLGRIETMTGLTPLDLPLIAEYHIDLGFDLSGSAPAAARTDSGARSRALEADECRLLHALQDGIEIIPEPFRALALRLGLQESRLLTMLDRCLEEGIVRRFGVIVRHHELGFRANAMAVWDVPDALVDRCGQRAAGVPAVTLAYRRRRQLPGWPYNLFCMVHGRERRHVADVIRGIAATARLEGYPHQVLFSTRRYKQCGARFQHAEAIEHG